jgi:hypothetical protein
MANPRQPRPEDLIFLRHTPIAFNGEVAVEYWHTCDPFKVAATH